MAAGIMTPAINRKLKEYRDEFGTDFMLEIAEAPATDELARIREIEKHIKSGVPQRIPEEVDGFY